MPTPATSDIEIAQRAMTLAGARPFDTWETNSDDCRTVKAFYEDLVRAELSGHDWKFCTGDSLLNRLADTPLYGFKAAYQVPSDPACLHVRSVHIGDQAQRWRMSMDKIYLDANETDLVILTHQFRQSTNLWPPFFTAYFECRLAAWACAAITRNGSLAEVWKSEAEIRLVKARSRDAMQQTVERLPIGRFTAMRRGART